MPNMSPKKAPMPTQEPNVRNKNFLEVATGYTEEVAIEEAQRCLNCKHKPCVSGCPVHISIPDFIKEVAQGNFSGAYDVISKSSSLPAVCGRVCPQETQCESKCVRGIKTEPVGIGRLERFVADWHNAQTDVVVNKPEPNGHKVAVVGSGPSGLTCAGDLAKMGYEHEERMPGIEADNTIRVNTNQADNTIRVNDASAKNDMDGANTASKNTIAENISATTNAVNAYKQTNGAIGGSSSGGSSKPALSLSEVNDAIANGNITPGVVDAYNYYNQTGYTIENFPGSSEDDSGTDYDSKIDSVYNSSSSTVQSYIRNRLKPLLQSRSITEDELKNDLLSNSANYDLEVDDMKAICNALDVNSMWVDNYKNKGVFGWGKGVTKK